MEQESQEEVSARERPRPVPRAEVPGLHRRVECDGREVLRVQPDRERPAVLARRRRLRGQDAMDLPYYFCKAMCLARSAERIFEKC